MGTSDSKHIIFCDSVVIVKKHLATLEIGNFSFELDSVAQQCLKLFEEATNNGHMLVIEDVVENELPKVLRREVHGKCDKLGKRKAGPERQKAVNKIEKKIRKFIDKYHANKKGIKYRYDKNNINAIKKFYNKRKEKLKKITRKKLSRTKDNKRKEEKLDKRENGYMPEKGDIKILASAIHANNKHYRAVGVWSKDNDFTEFKSEIMDEFSINIFDDSLPAKPSPQEQPKHK